MKNTSIIDAFTSDYASQQIFIITGNKAETTNMMLSIAEELTQNTNWFVVKLNYSTDLLKSLLFNLYYNRSIYSYIHLNKIDLSCIGLGDSIEESYPITDCETAIIRILEILKAENKRLLVCVSGLTNTESVRVFFGSFQIFMMHDLPIFLIGTGEYEEINEIQNENSLTFLYRAPKIRLNNGE